MKNLQRWAISALILCPVLCFGQGNTYSRVQINAIFNTLNTSKLDKSVYDQNRVADLNSLNNRVLNSVYTQNRASDLAAIANKITGIVAADRTAYLLITPIANTIIEVTVLVDSKYGNGLTEFKIMPNGDRWLVSFLTVKDN